VQTYKRVRQLKSLVSNARLYIQHERCHGFLARMKGTLVADDRTGLTYSEVLSVFVAFSDALITMAEVSLDFPPDSAVDRDFVKRHAVFGKCQPWASRRFSATLVYGTRRSVKLVRCYRKAPNFRVEIEFHSPWVRKRRIGGDFDELLNSFETMWFQLTHVLSESTGVP
jgi:hypothetical protein